jgi:hypothetical protein
MSYTLTPYLLDLGRLRALVGSKDQSVIAAIRTNDPERFDEEDDDSDGVSLGQALTNLIMGTPPGKAGAHQYGYALEAMAEHVGKRLEIDVWEGARGSALQALSLGQVFKRGAPITLPKYGDFPAIAYLTRTEIVELLPRVPTLRASLRDRSLVELLDEFDGWLKVAASEKSDAKDLLFCFY